MKKVIVLCGPTASGKTKLSIILSGLIDCEIINSDSRQIYRYLNIGTAKPTILERNAVTHYFIDIVNPDEHYDAGIFGKDGRTKILDILKRNKTPLVVGGSGLYIQSLIDGLFDGPGRDEEIRRHLEKRIETEGIDSLYKELCEKDPDSARKADPTKKRRIIRALEVYYLTGKPLSDLQKMNRIQTDFETIFFGLNWQREILYERVNIRAEEMVLNGLIEETCNLFSSGYNKDLKSMQTVGYKECFDYLEANLSYNQMIDLIKQNTRHYVKRQMTWFNGDKRIKWFDVKSESDFIEIAGKISEDNKK